MSLILEALRRSEAERQRARAPGLFVEHAALRRRRRAVPAWVVGVLAAALLAVLIAWAWQARRAEAPVTAAAVADAPVVAAPVVETPDDVAPAVDADVVAAPLVDAPVVRPEPVATIDAAAPVPAPEAIAPAPEPATAAPPVADAATPTIAAPTIAAPTVAAPIDEPLPSLATLSSAERAALPPLKLSMHVYSDEPARRFVIVDGRRLVEGAVVADGVVVDAIRRDGAVLAVGGRRVLLSRP